MQHHVLCAPRGIALNVYTSSYIEKRRQVMAGLMILRAGIIWGIVAILLTIIGNVLAPLLPVVAGLRRLLCDRCR
jgi:hypothetical protein